ncbi:MAG: hypothetical protein ISS77_02580 [Phycisphaerae bacterium]|nr:hypothetical protein [Planctomycetota bacterium]MBL7106482.1 hypothetical protein [Phycisphaerae bacterium]
MVKSMLSSNENNGYLLKTPTVLPDGQGGFTPCPPLLTEKELIHLLRIPEISKAKDHHNVIAHLKRVHDLPCIHICRQPLYPLEAISQWIRDRLEKEIS